MQNDFASTHLLLEIRTPYKCFHSQCVWNFFLFYNTWRKLIDWSTRGKEAMTHRRRSVVHRYKYCFFDRCGPSDIIKRILTKKDLFHLSSCKISNLAWLYQRQQFTILHYDTGFLNCIKCLASKLRKQIWLDLKKLKVLKHSIFRCGYVFENIDFYNIA